MRLLAPLLLLACADAEPGIDTADTGLDPVPPDGVNILCGSDIPPLEGAWAGILEGVRVATDTGTCDREDTEACPLTDGHTVVAELHAIEGDRWHTLYEYIRNDHNDDTRAFVVVHAGSAAFDACRITLF